MMNTKIAHSLTKKLSFLLLFLHAHFFFAQVYPVQTTIITAGPYYNYLSYYADENQHLQLIVTLTDFNAAPIQARLRFTITGPGYSATTKTSVVVGTPFTLNPGVPEFLNGIDLAPYFFQGNLNKSPNALNLNKLPEGLTTVCVDVIRDGVNQEIISTNNCTSFFLQRFQPTQSVLPPCASSIDPQLPFHTFQWTSPIGFVPSINTEINYTFSLYEWNDPTNFNIFQTGQGLVYSTVVQQPFVQLSTFDVTLQVGKQYVWRVQSNITSNGFPVEMIENNGLSEICTFTYGASQTVEEALADGLTINLNTNGEGERKGKAFWSVIDNTPGQGLSTFSRFLVSYRKQPTGNEGYEYTWFEDTVVSFNHFIYQLEPSTAYEVRVAGVVGAYVSDFSATSIFTTQNPRNYACGDADLPFRPATYTPLPTATAGMVFQIGQFNMTLTEVQALGSEGHFKGKGLVPVAFLGGAKAKVTFDDILVDNKYMVREGIVQVETKGLDQWLHEQYMQFVAPIYVSGVVDSAYVDTVNHLAWVVIDNVAQSWPFAPPDYPIIVNDENGNQYTIWPNGNVVVTTYLVVSENWDINPNQVVQFAQAPDETFGFDPKEHMQWHAQYEIMQLKDSSKYFVANKSMGTGVGDVVAFTPSVEGGTPNFELEDGTALTVSNGIIAIPAFASKGKKKIFVFNNAVRVGQLNVMVYDQKEKKVVLVPMGGAMPDTSSIHLALKNTLGEANLKFTLTLAPQWNNDVFTTSKAIELPAEVGLLSKYSDDMRALREAYFNDPSVSTEEDAYYVFVVPGFSDASIDGYMVRGKALGFVASGADATTYAHELGHGIGALEHSWKPSASTGSLGPDKGTSTNLMDYASAGSGITGGNLTLAQWKELRDFDVLPSMWDEVEDGESYSVSLDFLEPLSNPNSFTFINPNRGVFSIPKTASYVTFATLDRFVYTFSNNESNILGPIGSVLNFGLNGKDYSYIAGQYYEKSPIGSALPLPSAQYIDTLTNHDEPLKAITSFMTSASDELKGVYFLTDISSLSNVSNDSWIVFDNGTMPLSSTLGSFINHYTSTNTSRIEQDLSSYKFGVDASPLVIAYPLLDTFVSITPESIFTTSYNQKSVEYLIKYLLLCNYKKNEYNLYSSCIEEDIRNSISPIVFEQIMSCSTCVVLSHTNYDATKASLHTHFQEAIENALDMSDLTQFNELSPLVESGTLQQIKSWLYSKPTCLIRFMPPNLRAETFNRLITDDSFWNVANFLLKQIDKDDVGNLNQFTNSLASNTYGNWLEVAYPQLSEYFEADGSDFDMLKKIFGSFSEIYSLIPNNQNFSNTLYSKNIYLTNNPLTETPATYNYTALDLPIYFSKNASNTIGYAQDVMEFEFLNYTHDGVTVNFQNGKVLVNQNYNVWDASLSIQMPGTTAQKLNQSVSYELNPYELVTVHFLDNYAGELGFNKGDNFVVPAFYLPLYMESIDHEEWHTNYRLITDGLVIGASLLASPLTLGGSVVVLTALVAAADIDITYDRQNATTQEFAALESWDSFYEATMLLAAGQAVFGVLKSIAAPGLLLRSQVAFKSGWQKLMNVPNTAKNSLVSIRNAVTGVSGAGNFAKYTKIRSYLGDGRIKAYLNNQQLLDFENLLKTANDDVLKVMDEFKSADEFAEMVRGYKDNPTGFSGAIKTIETFNGSQGWLKFWRLTPRMENSLNTIAQLKSGNKIANVGNATDIQLSSIHAYTANGDFINVPYRYNPTWFGDYNTRAIQHINEGLNELRKISSRKIIDQTVFSGKTFSKTDFESKFLGKMNTTHSYNGYMSTSKLESVAEGFIDLTKQWATGSGEKIAVIQRVTSKNGVYIDDISDWGKNLGKTNHPDPKFINVQVQEEVLLNSQKLKQISEPIPVMVNGVHKTIDGMKVYYVDFLEIL